MNLDNISGHDVLTIREDEAVAISEMAQYLLRPEAQGGNTELHVWPEYATTLAIIISTGLDTLNKDGRIKT